MTAGGLRLRRWLEGRRRAVNQVLERSVPRDGDWPPGLVKAVEYSLLAGGKRFRPMLVLASAEACGGSIRRAMPAACAVELIHTYSLIHDDLPAMDDDDFRRGRPTSHRVFGEALAILAGDALLTLAFETLAAGGRLEKGTRLAILQEVARAAGGGGMVGGQVADISSEGKKVPMAAVRYIHAHKTGALITASVMAGALSAGAGAGRMRKMERYGRSLGTAFQIVDDVLDEVGDLEWMGKRPGSDRKKGKATYPAVAGIEASRREAARLGREARKALEGVGKRGWVLDALVGYVLHRMA